MASTSSASEPCLNRADHLCIPVQSSSVQFLHTPDQFYQTLINRISTAKKRIVLSALYLGSGEKEQQLVAQLRDALDCSNKNNTRLQVSLLFDYFRGTRGAEQSQSTTTMLRPLVASPSDNNVRVCLFHTPEMRGLLRHMLPERVNEVIGVQHMKFFIFDDSILISGANLSDQYFMNRQDRYLLIEDSPVLADFFCALFDIVAAHSYQLNSDGLLEFPASSSSIHPHTGSMAEIRRQINQSTDRLFAEFKKRIANLQHQSQNPPISDHQTFVFPFLQMGLFGVNQEVELLNDLFNSEDHQLDVTMMTAYFNLYESYADLILRKCAFPLTMVFGSPKSNGFYGASGPSGQIPSLYLYNAVEFVRAILNNGTGQRDKDQQQQQQRQFFFREWDRPGWTFHAKGLWVDSARSGTMATMVGSSNYGYRSVHRDLEAQLLLVTNNEALKGRMIEERNHLLRDADPVLDLNAFVRRGHLVPSWVKHFARLFRHFF